MQAKKIVSMSLLTAIALILFTIEVQIPNPIPIPGIKLGLANIVTVYAMFVLGSRPTLMILAARIGLGSIFTGHALSLLYSMAGGLFCYAVMLPVHRLVTEKQIWLCSAIAAIFHNIGQLVVAVAVTKTVAVLFWLPHLMIAAVITGAFTGICAQGVVSRLPKAE